MKKIDVGLYTTTSKSSKATTFTLPAEALQPPPKQPTFEPLIVEPLTLCSELEGHAKTFLERSKGKAGTTHETATQAALEALRLLAKVRAELKPAVPDPGAAFRIGWHLRQALDLLAGWQAGHGKKANPNKAVAKRRETVAARGGRKREKSTAFEIALIEAFDYWQQLPGTRRRKQTASAFVEWLKTGDSGDNIEYCEKADALKFSDCKPLKSDTIRKRIFRLKEESTKSDK
jgi:hypothetical protein